MTKEEALQGKKGKERIVALKKWREARRQERIAQRVLKANEPVNFPDALKPIANFFMMLKTASFDYAEKIEKLVEQHDVNLIIQNNGMTWSEVFDAYLYHPILNHNREQVEETISEKQLKRKK
jgi:hypothetical protein